MELELKLELELIFKMKMKMKMEVHHGTRTEPEEEEEESGLASPVFNKPPARGQRTGKSHQKKTRMIVTKHPLVEETKRKQAKSKKSLELDWRKRRVWTQEYSRSTRRFRVIKTITRQRFGGTAHLGQPRAQERILLQEGIHDGLGDRTCIYGGIRLVRRRKIRQQVGYLSMK
jgi:hypothetical protein